MRVTPKEFKKQVGIKRNRANPAIAVLMNSDTLRYWQYEFIPYPFAYEKVDAKIVFKQTKQKALAVRTCPDIKDNYWVVLYKNMKTRAFKVYEKPRKEKPSMWDDYDEYPPTQPPPRPRERRMR